MSQLRTSSLSIRSHCLVRSTTALILILAGGFNSVACSRSFARRSQILQTLTIYRSESGSGEALSTKRPLRTSR